MYFHESFSIHFPHLAKIYHIEIWIEVKKVAAET